MRSVIAELGFVTADGGERWSGEAPMVPELAVPGTAALRVSVLATWCDILTGFLAVRPMAPQVPLTLDLDVHLHRQATSGRPILGRGSVVKAGKRVVVCDARFFEDGDDEPFAIGSGTFMSSPGAVHVFPDGFVPEIVEQQRLAAPLAERLSCRVVEPGVAELPRIDDGLNAIGAIQGGLLTVAAEDAARSLVGDAALVSSMGVRYLRPFLVGPARATAERFGDVVLVRLVDIGQDKLGALATLRLS